MDPSQLKVVEDLAQTLYTSADTAARNDAQSRLLSLQTSSSSIPTCQYILDSSSHPYALLVASNSLTRLITTHWNSFSTDQRVQIRNYVLTYLANNPTLPHFISQQLIVLVCRITKLGWFDSEEHRKLTEELTKFLVASGEHCVLGLRVLNGLVEEVRNGMVSPRDCADRAKKRENGEFRDATFNTTHLFCAQVNVPTNGRTLTQHRKTAVSFRDQSLLKSFQIGVTTLTQLRTNSIQVRFLE